MRLVFFVFLFVSMSACSFFNKEKDPAEYFAWLNDPDNGLIKQKRINGLLLTVKYLPADLLAYQDCKNNKSYTPAQKDSLIKSYSNTMTFLLTVAPDETDSTSVIKDVMYYNLENQEEFQHRAETMNFEMEKYVELKTSDSLIYSPVLTNMENTYSLTNGRNITCVFAPMKNKEEFKKVKEFDFVWDDAIFQSGLNHFVFDNNSIFSSPRLKF